MNQANQGPTGLSTKSQSFNKPPKNPHIAAQPRKTYISAPFRSQINIITNNFKIKSKNHGVIYTYKVDFNESSGPGGSSGVSEVAEQSSLAEEEKITTALKMMQLTQSSNGGLETFQKFKIMNAHKEQLKKIFMQYIFVGNNLFSKESLDQQILVTTTKPFFNRFYTIIIERVSEFLLDGLNSMKMEEHPVALSFINSIIKTSLRNSKLTQIGRNPRFFMPSQAKVFHDTVETWPGFFTSSWIFQRGLYLIIDNISKFLSVDNCLTIINDRLYRYDKQTVNYDFDSAVVMANYGQKRTYKVHQIRWDMSPEAYKFEQSDQTKISMMSYFLKTYEKKITDTTQPLFEIRQKKQNIYLPPEYCTLVGIPPKVRENKRIMADIRQSLFQKPEDRIQSISELSKMISDSKEVKDWSLTINIEPDQIEGKVLKRPSILMGTTTHNLDEIAPLRSIVQQPINFQKWAIFCLQRDVANAKFIQDKFYYLSEQNGLNIFVNYGDIISLPNHSKIEDFKDAVNSYFRDYVDISKKKKPAQQTVEAIPAQFFLVIIPDGCRQEQFYTTLKNKINSDNPIISQFVTSRVISKENDRIYMNIIRQINAKLGGDLWRMNFGKEISKKTMLVGIDVCHKGKESTIGFVATYDEYMCKYYTQASPQAQKGKEIISSSILSEYFGSALKAYKDYNKKSLPDHIFIYRDGVGDSMRKQVIEYELQQLKKILTDEYDTLQTPVGQQKLFPHITLIIVNKRVRQRFFEKTNSYITNPPQGTYVDQGFVEQSEIIDGKFDFFLVPHTVTQGAVKPSHFYVAENTSKISKDAILNFTYALCYNYYNWPDSIKIPAPCMLADKIAIYRSEIGNIPTNVDMHILPFYL